MIHSIAPTATWLTAVTTSYLCFIVRRLAARARPG